LFDGKLILSSEKKGRRLAQRRRKGKMKRKGKEMI